jgi:NADH dehydrogenase
MTTTTQMQNPLPHVVVLGAGFGGLNFCKRFNAKARVTVVDRENYHLFQPLLYQVATGGLSGPDIAQPVRSILSKRPNIRVIMDEVLKIDLPHRRVALGHGDLGYDYLVIALGGRVTYFGHEQDWAPHAPGLKTLDDAMAIRKQVLCSFERAETAEDETERRKLMTIVIIGGGPTGVELAGALVELTRRVFRRDFRRIDPTQAKVILVEAADRLLLNYPPDLSHKARLQLEALGVEVRTGCPVTQVTAGQVAFRNGEKIEAENILWGAGVVASPLSKTLGVEVDKAGRIAVREDLSLPGYPHVFAVGDIVAIHDDQGQLVPAVAQGAIQMARHVAKLLTDELSQNASTRPATRPAFRYRDRGSMATIGRKAAIAWLGRLKLSGLIAWLVWLVVHLMFLIGLRNKLAVLLQWFYAYVTFKPGARIILRGESAPVHEKPGPDAAATASRSES